MSNFKMANPADNPQPGDQGFRGPYPRYNEATGRMMYPEDDGYDNLAPGEHEQAEINSKASRNEERLPHQRGPGYQRPIGETGVDKPHGGGTPALEAMAANRAPVDDRRRPMGNPNNPASTHNPNSTAESDLLGRRGEGERQNTPPVTTRPPGAVPRGAPLGHPQRLVDLRNKVDRYQARSMLVD